ncbi:peroxisome proliferator-activated receptor gamma coactivator 1-beta isoform X2 [Hyperolius riggenbachi]|uniref:peroxisome proliferator-activated receptor gamma coactivator 1-beta isoform X2 n=1 Tax=Hyperolius riggenbachi TaxID=752182 RepID=UPI0035A280B1
MADCSTLLDEDLESFVFSYLTDSPEPGEEPLSLDFPEIDLSQLDTGDFDSTSCFNELQWCNDHSDNEISQYSTDDSELFQIIDGDNEALLAALTQTLDDIPEDEISLSAFISSGDRDFCPAPALSPKPSLLAESSKSLETEDELSILKKLLLSPAQTPTSSDAHNDNSCRQSGTTKLRSQRQLLKLENPTERQNGVPQTNGRSCTELHRHLMSVSSVPPLSAKDDSNKEVESDSAEEDHVEDESGNSSLKPAVQSQDLQFTCEQEKQAVVDLIRYMHTYCLPPNKYHNDEKYQHCTSLQKRPKTDITPSVTSCSSQGSNANLDNAKGKPHAVGKIKKTKPSRTESSILKVLLAKDICGDVSKPYRLAKPVYAAITDLSCSHVTQGKTERGLGRGIGQELEKTHKPFLSLRKESKCMEGDSGRSALSASEQVTNKYALKQECSVYAVRRSSRLNPEFWFNNESAQPDMSGQITPEQSLYLTEQPFVDEEQVAEVEVEESLDTTCQVGVDRTPEDINMLEIDSRKAQNDSDKQQCHPMDNTRCPSVSLSQTNSAFEKRNFDQGLPVELCGTAGLTPPTTPPYKPAEEDLYKPDITQEPVNNDSLITSSIKSGVTEQHLTLSRRLSKKQPERTELFAHLSRTASLPVSSTPQAMKRPFSRSFGDHDYCQVRKSETAFQRKMIKSVNLPSFEDRKQKLMVPPVPVRKMDRKSESKKQDNKVLKDHEIRASLTKHFGLPDNTLKEEEDNVTCNSPEYDSVFEDSESECSSPDEELFLSPLRTKSCSRTCPPSKRQGYPRTQVVRSPDRRRTHRHDRTERMRAGHLSQRQIQRRREKDEGRVIVIRNLSSSINANELKRRFEVFGEITECQVLSKSRGEKLGFITYRQSEHAALSLKRGASLRKRNEPSFYMSDGGSRHLFWTKYLDLDSNAEETSSAVMKSKYESMDFDSLLKEAQRSLHR